MVNKQVVFLCSYYHITKDKQEQIDNDLFPRLRMLTNTLKADELTTLEANEILYRLYHEEDVIAPKAIKLAFGCTCSEEKSHTAIFQLGRNQALQLVEEQGGQIGLDCGFCGKVYHLIKTPLKKSFIKKHQLFLKTNKGTAS